MIRSQPRPDCAVCGAKGEALYRDLSDLTYRTPGTWKVSRCTSSSCRSLWLDPAPLEEDLPLAYVDYITHEAPPTREDSNRLRASVRAHVLHRVLGYPVQHNVVSDALARAAAVVPDLYARIARQPLYVPYKENGRLLEVGSGSGAQLAELTRLGWRCIGIDFDERAAQAARSRGLDVRVGALHTHAFEDASFDVVVMSHVIEHVLDARALLKECKRVLRRDGKLIVLTPNAESLTHRVAGSLWIGLDPPRHVFVYTVDSLRRLLQDCGYRDLEISTPTEMAPGFTYMDELRERASRDGSAAHLPLTPVPFSLRARATWRIEWALRKLGKFVGEEILVRAKI